MKIWLQESGWHQAISISIYQLVPNVADPDPGSGAFLTPGSGIRNRFFPDPGSQTYTFLGKKFYNSLKIGPNFFLQHFKGTVRPDWI
jgi:hypothetical protein